MSRHRAPASRWRRRIVGFVAALGLAVSGLMVSSTAASADSGPVFTVMNTDNPPPDGVWFRNTPHTADAIRVTGDGVYRNERVQNHCYAWGDAVGPYNNRLWYYATNVTRPTINGQPNVGYLNAHFINDGLVTNQVEAGVPQCGVTLASAPVSPTYVNGLNVGFPQNGRHWWGSCLVQDFNGGPYGWVIVSYNSNGTHLVRNGMLWGWFDNGGGPGNLGCPTTDEYSYMGGGIGSVREDFQHGSLYWVSGMNHAAPLNFSYEGALRWAWSHYGQVYDAGWCLKFVTDAYQYGQNWHLTGGPYGNSARAADWWYSQPSWNRHPGDTNPPRGTLVVWNYAASHDGSGHIALSLGGGWALSTEWGGNATVHIIHIADWPTHYLGWIGPR